MLLKGTKMAFIKLIHSGILMVKGYFTKKKKKKVHWKFKRPF